MNINTAYGFLGKRVINKEIFVEIENLVKNNNLIPYDGSFKSHKIYHFTTCKPGEFLTLKFSGNIDTQAKIIKVSVFSDKIVYILDNKKHVTVAEGDTVRKVLNDNYNIFTKLYNTILNFEEEIFIEKEIKK